MCYNNAKIIRCTFEQARCYRVALESCAMRHPIELAYRPGPKQLVSLEQLNQNDIGKPVLLQFTDEVQSCIAKCKKEGIVFYLRIRNKFRRAMVQRTLETQQWYFDSSHKELLS